MQIFLIFLFALTLIVLLLSLTVLPLLALVRCALFPGRALPKTLWILGIVLLWPIVGLLYGILRDPNRWLKLVHFLGMFALLASSFFVFYVYKVTYQGTYMMLGAVQQKLEQQLMDRTLDSDAHALVTTDITSMRDNLAFFPWQEEFKGKSTQETFYDILLAMKLSELMHDGVMSNDEAGKWHRLYENREYLDFEKLLSEQPVYQDSDNESSIPSDDETINPSITEKQAE
ncbi:MAG: hypothetical protein KDD76_00685 [Rickettsiales bacterium]|nr:hypothetical protein [Rickettsiales bacterium]